MTINVFWFHIRHLNPLKTHTERITKADRNMVNDLDYQGIEFPVFKKDYCTIEQKKNICSNVFCSENNLVYPVHISDQNFKDCIDLLMITDENNSHYVYIKILPDLCAIGQKIKIKNTFAKYCLQCFSSEKVLQEHEKLWLKING